MTMEYRDLAITMMTATQDMLMPFNERYNNEGHQWAKDVEGCLSSIASGEAATEYAFNKLISKYHLKKENGKAELKIVTLNGITRNAAALLAVFNGVVVVVYHYQARSWKDDEQFISIGCEGPMSKYLPIEELHWEKTWSSIMDEID